MIKVPKFTGEQLESLDKASLILLILELIHQIVQMAERIQALEDQLAKNSGKPSSSDGLKKKLAPKSLRESGQRPSGGQKGHKGETLEMVATPDHVEKHSLAECPHCQTDLSATVAQGVEKRQVFDLPPIQIEVTEHQVEVKCCPGCGQWVKGDFPAAVSQPVQYGNRVRAQVVYLSQYHLLPMGRLRQLMGDLWGHTPSEALIQTTNNHLARQIAPTLAAIETQLTAVPVLHCDETGMRVEGKLHWLHVACIDLLTYYRVHSKCGQEAMTALGILAAFNGRVVHDGWVSYFQLENCAHALCNAHHLRELRFIFEQYQEPWAQSMSHLLKEIYTEVQGTRDHTAALASSRIAHYEAHYYDILRQGFAAHAADASASLKKPGRPKRSPSENLLARLYQYKTETLSFMVNLRVPLDNNLAERDLCMMKVKQKISGTFRTLAGAETFCAIRSYLSTARKQGVNVFYALYDAFWVPPLSLPLNPQPEQLRREN